MLGEPRSGPPEDFVAFIERRAVDVAPADPVVDPPGTPAEGGGRLTARQRDEVLLVLARRWWWLRLQSGRLGRPHAADDLLDRMLAERLARWDPTAASLTVGPVRTPARSTTVLDQPLSMADLAGGVWREAGLSRRRRAAGAAGVAALVALLLFTVPRQGNLDVEPLVAPPVPVVTARPPLTDVVPTAERLAGLPLLAVPGLPGPTIDLSHPQTTPKLSASPVHRVTAAFEPDNGGAIFLLGDDGKPRLLDAPVPLNARLTSTSLSPDGTRLSLLTDTQAVVFDLTSGAIHRYPGSSIQIVTTVTWLGPTSIAVSDNAGTFIVDLVTGAVGNTRYVPGDLLQAQPPGPLAELISVDDPPTTPARIRHWTGDVQLNTALIPPPGGSLGWLGAWQGPGWQCGGVLVRDAATLGLSLPAADAAIGVAGAASLVVDEGSGAVRRILAFPGNPVALAVLGFLDPQTVLLRAGDQSDFGVLAWTWGTGQLHMVTHLSRVAVVSLAVR